MAATLCAGVHKKLLTKFADADQGPGFLGVQLFVGHSLTELLAHSSFNDLE